jgi:hypothetical protein
MLERANDISSSRMRFVFGEAPLGQTSLSRSKRTARDEPHQRTSVAAATMVAWGENRATTQRVMAIWSEPRFVLVHASPPKTTERVRAEPGSLSGSALPLRGVRT